MLRPSAQKQSKPKLLDWHGDGVTTYFTIFVYTIYIYTFKDAYQGFLYVLFNIKSCYRAATIGFTPMFSL